MKIILSPSNNPYYNLSLEETLLKDEKIKDNILLLYINHNTIVIGRNQNMWEEINSDYVKKHNISLIRRVSGGGAVYHDEGNLNFSFITSKTGTYESFLKPVIGFLKTLGLEARFEGKNDISVNGFKISGNAQYRYKDRMFHHGTLLFKSNLKVLGETLKPNKLKLESKSIKSARARVSNIYDLLDKKITPKEFRDKFIDYFQKTENAESMEVINYKEDDINELGKIRKSDEWNYGKNPQFNLENAKRFPGGTITLKASVDNNKITDLTFYGDFLSSNDFEKIYPRFKDISFNKASVLKTLNSIDNLKDYFGKITKEEIIELFFDK